MNLRSALLAVNMGFAGALLAWESSSASYNEIHDLGRRDVDMGLCLFCTFKVTWLLTLRLLSWRGSALLLFCCIWLFITEPRTSTTSLPVSFHSAALAPALALAALHSKLSPSLLHAALTDHLNHRPQQASAKARLCALRPVKVWSSA